MPVFKESLKIVVLSPLEEDYKEGKKPKTSGKSTLVAAFVPKYLLQSPTVGFDPVPKQEITVDGQKQSLQIWDTSGQEKFSSLLPMHMRETRAIVICVGDGNTNIDFALTQAKENNIPFVIALTKSDLRSDQETTALTDNIKAQLTTRGFDADNTPIINCSANNKENVQQVFDKAAQLAVSVRNAAEARSKAVANAKKTISPAELEQKYTEAGGNWFRKGLIFGFWSKNSISEVERALQERARNNNAGASSKTLEYKDSLIAESIKSNNTLKL